MVTYNMQIIVLYCGTQAYLITVNENTTSPDNVDAKNILNLISVVIRLSGG